MKTFVTSIPPFLLILFFLTSYSQTEEPTNNKTRVNYSEVQSSADGASSSGQSSAGYSSRYNDLGEECSMYFNDDWIPGSIELKDGTTYNNCNIRYNIYNQQMEYAFEGDTAAIGNPEEIERIQIGKEEFVYRNFECKHKVSTGYLNLLVEGDYELLCFRSIIYTSKVYADKPDSEDEVKYHLDKKYFLGVKGQTAQLLPEKKKEIIALLNRPESEIKSYLKQKGNKLKSDEELIDLFVYVNN